VVGVAAVGDQLRERVVDLQVVAAAGHGGDRQAQQQRHARDREHDAAPRAFVLDQLAQAQHSGRP
jgi:hypothetical protein